MASHTDWRSRLIDIASMDTSLRRVLATLYALLIGFAIAAALRTILPGPNLMAQPGILIPFTVVLICGLGLSLSLAMLLAGTAAARTPWRFLAVVPVLAVCAILAVPVIPDAFGALYGFAAVFLAGACAVLALGPKSPWARTMQLSGLLFLCVAIAATAFTVFGDAGYAATIVFLGLGMIVFPIEPALMVVGFDLAEISALSVVPTIRRMGARRGLGAAFWRWASILAALGMAYWLNDAMGASYLHELIVRSLILCLLTMGICWGLWARDFAGPARQETLGYWHVFLVAACLIAMSLISTAFTEPKEGYLNYEGAHRFSVAIPDGWSVSPSSQQPTAENDDNPRHWVKRVLVPTGKKLPRVAIVGAMRPPHAPLNHLPQAVNDIEGGSRLPTMFFNWSAPDAKGWKHGEQTVKAQSGTELRFLYWAKEISTQTALTNKNWYIVCGIPAPVFETYAKDCAGIQKSFWVANRMTPSPWGEFLFGELFWFAFAASGLALIAWTKRAEPILWLTIWVACVMGTRNLGVAGLEFADVFRDRQLSADIMAASILSGAAALGLCEIQSTRGQGAGWQVGRDVAMSFLLTVMIITAAFLLYVWASAGSAYSEGVKGAVICLALTWDLWTSGGTMTNHSGPVFSRASRILIFGGYLLLIASATIMFSEMDLAFNAMRMQAWDADGLAIAGLTAFGLAFAFMRHAQRLAVSLPPPKKLQESAPPPSA
jgi:hypothetical protein